MQRIGVTASPIFIKIELLVLRQSLTVPVSVNQRRRLITELRDMFSWNKIHFLEFLEKHKQLQSRRQIW